MTCMVRSANTFFQKLLDFRTLTKILTMVSLVPVNLCRMKINKIEASDELNADFQN